MPRIVFMGTPEFSVATLRACFELGDVVAVVTQPDKPRGRGQEVSVSPVKALALERGVPVLQPPKVRGTPFAQELAAYAPDVSVVAAYGKILPKDVLETPKHGSVNVHGSLLPRFRGAAPIQWAIALGDTETGVCLMKMDEGMDTGGVFARGRLPIAATETSGSLHDKLAVLGAALMTEHLLPYLNGERPVVPQPVDGIVMAPMIKKEDGKLDFSGRSAIDLERRSRGFTPWPGAWTTYSGALLKVPGLKVGTGQGAPATVLTAGKEGIEVACKEGSLWFTSLQPEGKKPMDAAGFLNGRKLERGSAPFGAVHIERKL